MKQNKCMHLLAVALCAAPLLAAAEDGASVPRPWSGPVAGAVDFGQVQTGQASNTQQVVVSNSGTGPVTYLGFSVTQPSTGAQFKVAAQGSGNLQTCAANLQLAPGASCGLTVSFLPAAGSAGVGAKSAWLNPVFQATAPSGKGVVTGASPGAKLSGAGVLPSGELAPAALNFALTASGQDASAQYLTLTNTGIGPVAFLAARLDGYSTQYGSFSLAPAANAGTEACSSAHAMQPGDSCSLRVGYHASRLGSTVAHVLVDLSDGAARPAQVTLTGRAALPPGKSQHN